MNKDGVWELGNLNSTNRGLLFYGRRQLYEWIALELLFYFYHVYFSCLSNNFYIGDIRPF